MTDFVYTREDLEDFLYKRSYEVEKINSNYYFKLKNTDFIVKLHEEDGTLFISTDIEKMKNLLDSKELYKELLKINSQILPISVAIDFSLENEEKLIVNDSLETINLDENEIVKVLDTFEKEIENIKSIIEKYKK